MFSLKIRYTLYGMIISASLITLVAQASSTDGVFGIYFRNMITTACSWVNILTWFDDTNGSVAYGTKICTALSVPLAAYDIYPVSGNLGIGAATIPNASLEVKRIKTDGNYVAWLEGQNVNNYGLGVNIANTTSSTNIADFQAGSNSKLLIRADGNVWIGTSLPTAKLEVAGNIIAATPTANNHVATKGYVDTAVAGAATNEMANCIPASTALMDAKWLPKTLCYNGPGQFSCYYASSRMNTNIWGWTSAQAIYYDSIGFPNAYHNYYRKTMIYCTDNTHLSTNPKNHACYQNTTYWPGWPTNETQVLPLSSYCMIY